MQLTVSELIKKLQKFPDDWTVIVKTQAGGDIALEHREVAGKPVVGIFGSNGGSFGENPFTEEEYQKQSKEFMRMWNDRYYRYTSIHGDHRMYHPSGLNDTCYGVEYDLRVVERLVDEGFIPFDKVDINRVRYFKGYKPKNSASVPQ